jgi:hypothetical protein
LAVKVVLLLVAEIVMLSGVTAVFAFPAVSVTDPVATLIDAVPPVLLVAVKVAV